MIIYWTSIDHSEHATLAASHLLDAVLNGLLCTGHVLACRKWLQLQIWLVSGAILLITCMYVSSSLDIHAPVTLHIKLPTCCVLVFYTITEVFDINCPAIVGISKLMRIIC
jgi:hypothetical protein